MSTALLVVHPGRPAAAALAKDAVVWLERHGHDAVVLETDADGVAPAEIVASEHARSADLALSIGGDGTVLRTVELVSAKGVPIVAVNVGLLGYLSEVEPDHLIDALVRYFSGDHDVEERMMVTATLGSDSFVGLNEVVVEKRSSGHTVRLLVRIDGTTFTSYAADGLIVATPTGSTAYSLSARGPIVSPTHRALLLTPVSPHMLFDRSLVLNPDEEVAIEVIGEREAEVSVDGRRVGVLAPGEGVTCRRAAEVARFVRFGQRHFHGLLKAKFGLSDR